MCPFINLLIHSSLSSPFFGHWALPENIAMVAVWDSLHWCRAERRVKED